MCGEGEGGRGEVGVCVWGGGGWRGVGVGGGVLGGRASKSSSMSAEEPCTKQNKDFTFICVRSLDSYNAQSGLRGDTGGGRGGGGWGEYQEVGEAGVEGWGGGGGTTPNATLSLTTRRAPVLKEKKTTRWAVMRAISTFCSSRGRKSQRHCQ